MAPRATDPAAFNVLIVDDFPGAADWLAILLEHGGFPARIARTGAEALRIGRDFRPRAVIMDLMLPDASGIDIACQLRREPACADSHFIALTGRGDDELRNRWRREGLGPYLRKPVPSENLLDLLEELRLAGAPITLPVRHVARAPQPPPHGGIERARLLVIEDNPVDVLMLERALREHLVGFDMDVIENGAEALRWLEAYAGAGHEIVIIDLNLPAHDGLELLRRFRDSQKFPGARFVVLTSSAAQADRDRAEAIGVDCFIRKPTRDGSYIEIGQVLRRLLESHDAAA